MNQVFLNGHDMSDYRFEHIIASRHGGKYNKDLLCIVVPSNDLVFYQVISKDSLVIDTQDFAEACKYYEDC